MTATCRHILRSGHNPCVRAFSSESSSSSASTKANNNDHLGFSTSSLGLDRSFILPCLSAIRELPEVDAAWTEFPSYKSVDNLHRASDVFASFNKGGTEHTAVCAMLAECQSRLGLIDEALHTLVDMCDLAHTSSIPNGNEDLILAQAKVLWTKGDFSQSEELCDTIVNTYDDLQENFPTTNLHMASAMSGKALSQLAAMKTLDDAFSVRDYFRIALKFLERHPPQSNSLPLAVAHANCGTAEAIYAVFLEETNEVSVPMDSALRDWFLAKQKIDSEVPLHLRPVSLSLDSRIQANLAWGVLNYEEDRSDRLTKASDYAGKALSLHNPENDLGNEGICRVLSIVASCYNKAGSAVTAEGLFQSAIDKKNLPPGPLHLLELQDAYRWYAELLKSWEKREGDAHRFEEKVSETNELLPEPWKGKSGLHGSLWFWTPAEFV